MPRCRLNITAPASVTHGSQFSVTVQALDAYGNLVPTYTGTVRFTSSDGSASLPANYTFTMADGGSHNFGQMVLRKRGTKTITVTDTHNLRLPASVSIDVT